ncbi:hypothetical protein [Bifidobacterium myosotis]|uniref:Uncharacterized protein n=1 Tax=Bifidobacterium myosotis TaxID=1630166 RepID=A0A5M9ZI01_9BIFI|nr:hypothetical protein [Bifidobacterium myosotis]KAA8827251.1 hypothetical protein EMO91_09415 [Bifidobacterium myosotis]
MNMQLIGKAAGTATLTVASTVDSGVKALIPVTVVSNMLRYGPATGLAGDTATVNEDGTLTLSGADVANSWNGVAWDQDTAKFKPGTRFTLSCDGLGPGMEMLLQFNSSISSGNIFTVPARGGYTSSGTAPATVNTVRLVIRRISGSTPVELTGTVKPMCNLGDKPIPWVKPDDTNTPGGGDIKLDAMNLWQYPALPVTKQGATFSAGPDGGLHIKAVSSVGAAYRILSAPVELEAGDYTLTLDGKTTDAKWLTAKVRSNGKDSLSAPTGAPATGTLAKGSYTCEVHVLYNAVFENDYTVTLTRTATSTATVGAAVVGDAIIGKQ